MAKGPSLFLKCLGTIVIVQEVGIVKQGRADFLPYSSVKTFLNFQRACTSITKKFFHFVRSWKIVDQFMHVTMVV
jgi:hypothetical protein